MTREQLIIRVEGKLGKGCFGDSAWEDTFFRDMQVVKQALRASGYQPAYSRSSGKSGYYLRDQAAISTDLERILDSCVLAANPLQVEIFKKLTFAQRFQKGVRLAICLEMWWRTGFAKEIPILMLQKPNDWQSKKEKEHE